MEAKDEITVAGTLTYEDFKRHNSYHRRKFLFIYFALVFLFFVFYWASAISGSWIMVYPIAMILSLVTLGVIMLMAIPLLNRKVRKEFKTDQLIQIESSYVINNEGIHQKVRRSNTLYEWSDIYVVKENYDMFRLYISKNKAIILPNSFFTSMDEIDMLRTLIKENLDSKKVKIKS
ncbi:YcxB family protein [Gracilibacillus caseinilyticus]|uniref:YcxB family protein n=1 Tax=Gracilibacillus caseinilyticus TaxID=2932256 RepID=A0ABY4EZ47_9BACI|nr:YcxB family protein [Gracilibacillus caseinilyticus]UOQ49675.1 YcxB family protein [Gracilibacillus caseinilyticus]